MGQCCSQRSLTAFPNRLQDSPTLNYAVRLMHRTFAVRQSPNQWEETWLGK